jgi:hypothetical protein
MKTFTIFASLTAIASFWALPALADVAPPACYVETCTAAKVVTANTECLECAYSHMVPDRCKRMLEPFCYSMACRAWGSRGNEIYCRSKNASAPAVPQEISSVLLSPSMDPPSVPSPGACPPPGTDTVTVTTSEPDWTSACTATATATATSTATTTEPAAEKKDDSGCSYGAGKALDAIGPWGIALVGLLLASLRRRRK